MKYKDLFDESRAEELKGWKTYGVIQEVSTTKPFEAGREMPKCRWVDT